MKIYTRTGDEGQTGLFGGGRVSKSHRRVSAYGEVDELNAVLGWTLTVVTEDALAARLRQVQSDLFAIGGHLATPPGARSEAHLPDLPHGRAVEFEGWMDEADAELEPLRSFILPGGAPAAAALHVARTVCRRAERAVVALVEAEGDESVDRAVVVYLNRLSDLLFQLARQANRRAGVEDVPWTP